ncbi:hypothetical protein TNCV_3589711 [Trichonephila clavipes]|nr:hypothetical protein TNCV_3589711 [Trichonephila clavipes]
MKLLRRGPMSVNGLKNMIHKFEETGELGVIPGKRGRHPVNLERVQEIDDAIATTCTRSGAIRLQEVWLRHYLFPGQLCKSAAPHILRCCPYKIKMLQELKPHDDSQRIDFANFVLSKITEEGTWIQRILFDRRSAFYTIR